MSLIQKLYKKNFFKSHWSEPGHLWEDGFSAVFIKILHQNLRSNLVILHKLDSYRKKCVCDILFKMHFELFVS